MPARYHKIGHDPIAIQELFARLFLEAYSRPSEGIIIDLDATDNPLHGHQEGRFFHGYYDCYCYLPLYIFCGRHLLAAKLRRSNIDASAGARVTIRQARIGSISALVFLASAPPSWAAPLSTSAGELKADRAANSGLEKAAYRRCWWRHGERICRWVGYRS
jgi:hypothetical protein